MILIFPAWETCRSLVNLSSDRDANKWRAGCCGRWECEKRNLSIRNGEWYAGGCGKAKT